MFKFTFLSDRKEVEGVRGITGCSSKKEDRVTDGSKMRPEVAVEEAEVVTIHMLLGKAVTRR